MKARTKKPSKPAPPTVSILVTARNNGKYIRECIESCLNQTVKAIEVIYSDDNSTDDSLRIVKRIPGVKIVEHAEWVGVVRARNDCYEASTGEALIFVDGDDILPPTFVEDHLSVFTPETPFVYAAAQAFGECNKFWQVREWEDTCIWIRNFVNTSCMMNRWAFEKAGRWQETCKNTVWDWHMALRLSRLGIPKKSPAVLHYRYHSDSWSHTSPARTPEATRNTFAEVRRSLVTMSIGLVYSGRLEPLMPYWLDNLISDVSILANKPELIVVNNSQKPIRWITSYHAQFFSKVKILKGYEPLKWESEKERRIKVSALLADCCNMVLEHSTGELVHFREDDMLTTPDSFRKLYEFITDIAPDRRIAAVGALYLNRHHDQYVGGICNTQNHNQTRSMKPADITGIDPVKVDFTGTGCLVFWKSQMPEKFYPQINNINAHDWRFCLDAKAKGKTVWILPDAVCRHYCSVEFKFVEPSPEFQSIIPSETYSKPFRDVKM